MSVARVDPQQAVATIRRSLNGAPAQVAEGVARLIRNSSEDRLERLMSSPARRVILETIFWQMPKRLDRRRAAGAKASIRWRITGGPGDRVDTYQLQLEDGRCQVIRGENAPEPRVTLTVDGAEFLRIATGSSDATRAHFSGRVGVAGDIMAAAKLASMFIIPGRR